jgi:Rieske Fe-S protein
MKSSFSKGRRDVLKPTGMLAVATAHVFTDLGGMLSNWDAPTKALMCPCHDALFGPLQEGKNTGGATSRILPYFPVKAIDGNIVVAGEPSGYVGVKRIT